MKPSEYFLSESPLRVKLYMGEFNKTKTIFDELDKQFIDREELKEKINKLFNPKISNGEHSIQITKKEILELIDKC